jgi:hypothetical protein
MKDGVESSLALLKRQRSHVIFVLSAAKEGNEEIFLRWFQGHSDHAMAVMSRVLSRQHFKRHEVDITMNLYGNLPFPYLGIYEISVDGAEGAQDLIESISSLYVQNGGEHPATWLYYPASEKVGRAPRSLPTMIAVAFANGLPGREAEFREWYATRHIRHAMNIPAFVSGQCFKRTLFQMPGSMEANYDTIALYEVEGTPESIIEANASLPKGTLDFPSLDISRPRFFEWVYVPL